MFYEFKFYVELGGLRSRHIRIFSGYVDKILKGEKPGNIPVELPTTAPLALASPLPEIAISILR